MAEAPGLRPGQVRDVCLPVAVGKRLTPRRPSLGLPVSNSVEVVSVPNLKLKPVIIQNSENDNEVIQKPTLIGWRSSRLHLRSGLWWPAHLESGRQS